ncbi:MAG: hypothetical protein H5U06_02925 [Candidatus Aminicenantes bacterium]|nr:hypothetical protein [Candidatus Aminicenantes bacterium]
MTRSGPFYHLAGLMGDELARLKSHKKARSSFFNKREYVGFITNYYVYITRIE